MEQKRKPPVTPRTQSPTPPQPFSPPQSTGTMLDVQMSKAAQEVQAAVIMAKKFPRDSSAAQARIIDACKRQAVAESGLYAYKKGGGSVTGASIRLAEIMAQNWGNMDFGIRELSRDDYGSTMEAYAWDIETNVRQSRVFQVPHEQFTKRGSRALADPREKYEANANQGARRLRACILGLIPGDIVEAAEIQCENTMRYNKAPIAERIKQVAELLSKVGATREMLEMKMGHKLEATSETELVKLQAMYRSLKDGYATIEHYFSGGPDNASGEDMGYGNEDTEEGDEG